MIEILLAAAVAVSGIVPAFAAETHDFNVPAESASDAIRDFASQAHVQILADGQNVKDKQLHALSGSYSTDQGLRILLADSGLSPQYVSDRSIALVTASQVNGDRQKEEEKSPRESFRMAQVDHGSSAVAAAVAGETSKSLAGVNQPGVLEEVLVTAQKRTERQQDVPVAMTVLDPLALAQNGQNGLADYFASIPSLTVSNTAYYGGTTKLTIRGLSQGWYENPTVATVIDDVPVAPSTLRTFGALTSPNLDPSDLGQIEVLKGPQGTLYGAASLGGLVKYVTVDPSTGGFGGRLEAGAVDVSGGGVGYVVRGAANIPVSDTLAFRVSAFSRLDPGYIDNLTTGQNDVNSSDVYGGRVSGLWRPSENLSVKLGVLIQEAHGDASLVNSNSLIQFTAGDLKMTALPGSTSYKVQNQLYSANIDWKVGRIDITSVTGYAVNKLENWKDLTAYAGPQACTAFPVTCQLSSAYPSGSGGAPAENGLVTDKVSEELRLSSSIGHWLDWRLGGFYTHEHSPTSFQAYDAANLTTGEIVGNFYTGADTTLTFAEHAVFGDLTAHVTDRFDVEFGARESWNHQKDQLFNTGPATFYYTGANPPYLGPLQAADGSAFTYRVVPKFKISDDLMAYASVATGYRVGGYNPDAFNPGSAGFGIPPTYAPDRTTNFELGLKGDVLEHKLSFDLAAYYIRWRDFQINVLNEFFDAAGQEKLASYTANAGNAKSQGLELTVEAHPLDGLTVGIESSFNNAVLTQDLPNTLVYGVAGERLPYSMRWSGGLTLNQDIRLYDAWLGFVGGSVNYVGSRPYEFTYSGSQPRIMFPAYAQVNLHTGARYQSWMINLYVNNVADKRGVIGLLSAYAVGTTGGYYGSVIQPRTVGVNVSKQF